MNYDSLLNIINGIIKNEEKFEESPNEIYSLFKKHGYERDIETLKLDLKNLLNDVIKSDEELSKVAGGKVSKLAAGAVAALTCFPMNSFASGTANTNQNKHSAVNKITDSIKSGAKKVGDATKEHVIEPAKDAAKTIARNPGKSATVTTALVVYGLLSGLAGKKLGTLPELDTQGMTDEEKERVVETHKVLQELTKNFYIEVNENEFSWNLSEIKALPNKLNGKKIKIGALTSELMPEKFGSTDPTPAYASARETYIKYEKALSTTLEKQKQKIEKKMENQVKTLTTENEKLKTQANQKEKELKQKTEELNQQKTEYEEEIKKKDDEIKNLNEKHGEKTQEKLKEQNEQFDKKIKELEEQHTKEKNELEEKLQEEKDKIKEKEKQYSELQNKLTILTQDREQNKNAKILLHSYTDLQAIYKTINAALVTTLSPSIKLKSGKQIDLEFLKNQVSSGDIKSYNVFRKISDKLRSEKDRPEFPESWEMFTGDFSLAEILLQPTTNIPEILKDENNLTKVNIASFGKTVSKYKTNQDLRNAAKKTQTWLEWLKPYSNWGITSGIKNDSVVNQLPELIIAACTLPSPQTLVSLLNALENHLSADTTSEYRGKVNTALAKVGMRFDDNICKLVSTNPSKK